MGFWEDLKVVGADLLAKGNVFAKEAAQKASDAADMAKIKVDITAREREIKELYMKIGKAYYEEYKDDALEFAEDISEITAKYAAIGELKSKYAMYKDAMKAAKEEKNAAAAAGEEACGEAEDAIIIVPADEEDAADTAEKVMETDAEYVEEPIEAAETVNETAE